MAFHDVRFPTAISFGSVGGPERRTEIVALSSGHEQRNSPWAHSRRRYDAGYGLRGIADIETVVAFFEARHGPLHAFRWRDPLDWRSCAAGGSITPTDQVLGVGDGATTSFSLIKSYASGEQSYSRTIDAPDADSLRVAVDGVETSYASLSDGLVTLPSAPATGAAVTAGFSFDVPARFDSDGLSISLAAFGAGEIPSIPIIEVRL